MTRLFVIMLLAVFFAAPCAAADTAPAPADMSALRARAEKGEAAFQAYFGYLYSQGAGGLAKNDSEAFKWYKKAADQGYAPAQYNLGILYDEGRGVPQNRAAAYFWLHLAASTGKKDYAARRDRTAQHLTLVQMAQLKKRAAEWKAALTSASPEGEGASVVVPWIRVPLTVQKTITAEVKSGGMIDRIELVTLEGRGVYRAVVNEQGSQYMIDVENDGTLITSRRPPEENEK